MEMLSIQVARVGEVPLYVLLPPALTQMHGPQTDALTQS